MEDALDATEGSLGDGENPANNEPKEAVTVGAGQEIRGLLALYDWPQEKAYCIVMRESSGNSYAVSATDDHGLMQLNRPTWQAYFGARWANVYDPAENIAMGYEVYLRAGRTFSPWTSANGC